MRPMWRTAANVTSKSATRASTLHPSLKLLGPRNNVVPWSRARESLTMEPNCEVFPFLNTPQPEHATKSSPTCSHCFLCIIGKTLHQPLQYRCRRLASRCCPHQRHIDWRPPLTADNCKDFTAFWDWTASQLPLDVLCCTCVAVPLAIWT